MATIPANNADWNSATDASAFEKASFMASNDAGEFFIIWITALSSPTIIVVYPL